MTETTLNKHLFRPNDSLTKKVKFDIHFKEVSVIYYGAVQIWNHKLLPKKEGGGDKDLNISCFYRDSYS